MDNSVKDVFDDECKELVIDARFMKRVNEYQVGFVNKNADHIAFFGGNLLGVQVVRFLDTDKYTWFNDILEVNEDVLTDRLHALPTINKEWSVSSNVFNLSCAWLCHAVLRSSKLNDHQKHNCMMDILLVMQYRFMTSLLFNYFRYPADEGVAEATYAQLSKKFAIKEHGSWFGVFKARSEDMLDKHSLHYKTLQAMDDDADVVYFLNDAQGRIRAMVKNIYAVFIRTKTEGNRITTTSSVVEHDGEEILKDKTRSLVNYTRYINTVVTDKNSFIREELVQVVERLMSTAPPRLIRATLAWMSANYRQRGADMVEYVLNESLIHAFGYMGEDKMSVRRNHDLPGLIVKLKGVYGSSRSTDPALFQLRDKTESIVKLATHNKNDAIVSSVRTAVLLYIVVRALTMRHYTASVGFKAVA